MIVCDLCYRTCSGEKPPSTWSRIWGLLVCSDCLDLPAISPGGSRSDPRLGPILSVAGLEIGVCHEGDSIAFWWKHRNGGKSEFRFGLKAAEALRNFLRAALRGERPKGAVRSQSGLTLSFEPGVYLVYYRPGNPHVSRLKFAEDAARRLLAELDGCLAEVPPAFRWYDLLPKSPFRPGDFGVRAFSHGSLLGCKIIADLTSAGQALFGVKQHPPQCALCGGPGADTGFPVVPGCVWPLCEPCRNRPRNLRGVVTDFQEHVRFVCQGCEHLTPELSIWSLPVACRKCRDLEPPLQAGDRVQASAGDRSVEECHYDGVTWWVTTRDSKGQQLLCYAHDFTKIPPSQPPFQPGDFVRWDGLPRATQCVLTVGETYTVRSCYGQEENWLVALEEKLEDDLGWVAEGFTQVEPPFKAGDLVVWRAETSWLVDRCSLLDGQWRVDCLDPQDSDHRLICNAASLKCANPPFLSGDRVRLKGWGGHPVWVIRDCEHLSGIWQIRLSWDPLRYAADLFELAPARAVLKYGCGTCRHETKLGREDPCAVCLPGVLASPELLYPNWEAKT